MHGLHVLLCSIFKKNMLYFYCICSWKLVPTIFIFHGRFLIVSFFWEGVSYCQKVLRLRCCRGPKSSWVCTNLNCMCKQSYSSASQKITTGHCEFNVWPLYLIFEDLISIDNDAIDQWSCIWTDHKVVIIISKEMRNSFKCC